MSNEKLKNRTPTDCIAEALETFRERNQSYGDNYLQHGKIMTVLFPNGIELKTVEDWNRFGIINMIIAKMTRYAQNWPDVNKVTIDSLHDLGVYSFMLESIDSFKWGAEDDAEFINDDAKAILRDLDISLTNGADDDNI